jgi:DNA-binding CsgD family transcriptional regulator
MEADRDDKRGRWLLAAAAAGMLTLLLAGEFYNEGDDLELGDMLFEILQLVLLVGGTAASVLLVLRMRTQEEENRVLRRDLEAILADGRRWREEMAYHLHELGNGIRRQFEAWRLTPAEQEVGLLLLKGFSHKEIARFRNTSEATIRQQAAALYQKANLSGRAALSAFFLEDLLTQPQAERIAAPSARERLAS